MQQKLLEGIIEGFALAFGAAFCALLVKELGWENDNVETDETN